MIREWDSVGGFEDSSAEPRRVFHIPILSITISAAGPGQICSRIIVVSVPNTRLGDDTVQKGDEPFRRFQWMRIMNQAYEREQGVAIEAVRAASRLCRAVRASVSPDVLAKKDKSPVTVADFGSQALICRVLAAEFPDDPVIAEENSAELRLVENMPILDQVLDHLSAAVGSEGVRSGTSVSHEQVYGWIDRGWTTAYRERFWTLDPIDGTKGFLRGEQYAVALALVVNGQVAVAALACPGLPAQAGDVRGQGSIFSAIKGQGAFVRAAESDAASDSSPVRIRVTSREDPAVAAVLRVGGVGP